MRDRAFGLVLMGLFGMVATFMLFGLGTLIVRGEYATAVAVTAIVGVVGWFKWRQYRRYM